MVLPQSCTRQRLLKLALSSLLLFNHLHLIKPTRSNPFGIASLNDRLKSRSEFHTLYNDAMDDDREKESYDDFNAFWHKARLFTRNIARRYAQTEHSRPIVLYEYNYLLGREPRVIEKMQLTNKNCPLVSDRTFESRARNGFEFRSH